MALVTTVIFCRVAGLTNIIVEGDSLLAVNLLKKDVENWSQGGLLVAEAKAVLNSFARWSSSHVRRQANQVAHLLAQ